MARTLFIALALAFVAIISLMVTLSKRDSELVALKAAKGKQVARAPVQQSAVHPGGTNLRAQPPNQANASGSATAANLGEKVAKLRSLVAGAPHLAIPELALLSSDDWEKVAATSNLESEEGFRDAAHKLRKAAKEIFSRNLVGALQSYYKASGGKDPTEISQLLPFISLPIAPSFLSRYDLVQTDIGVSKGKKVAGAAIKEKSIVDPEIDSEFQISRKGFSAKETSAVSRAQFQANQDYRAVHGRPPTSQVEILPYVKDEQMREKLANKLKPGG